MTLGFLVTAIASLAALACALTAYVTCGLDPQELVACRVATNVTFFVVTGTITVFCAACVQARNQGFKEGAQFLASRKHAPKPCLFFVSVALTMATPGLALAVIIACTSTDLKNPKTCDALTPTSLIVSTATLVSLWISISINGLVEVQRERAPSTDAEKEIEAQ